MSQVDKQEELVEEFDKLNEIEAKQELLKKYVRDLDRLMTEAGLSLSSQMEQKKSSSEEEDLEQDVPMPDMLAKRTKRRQAYEMLIKAEQLNEQIEREMSSMSLLTDETSIQKRIEEFWKERNVSPQLKDEFRVGYEFAKRKRRLKLDEFVGLDALRAYFDSIWTSLSSSEKPRVLDNSIRNAFVFGPKGCGKVSFLMNWLLEMQLIERTSPQKSANHPRVDVFFIDIDFVLSRHRNVEFLGRLLDSINQHAAQQQQLELVLVVIKRLERLFESPHSNTNIDPSLLEQIRWRFLADLIFNIELSSFFLLFRV